MRDLWQYLQEESGRGRPIVMYGMGNGADKILAVLADRGVPVADFFASDGFVRGHSFHGKVVLSYSAMREKYAGRDPIVLLSFASSRPEVLELIGKVASECELYAPDVPVAGTSLFDAAFYEANRSAIEAARALFADDESRRVYDGILDYKLSGRIEPLRATESDPDDALRDILHAENFVTVADLGAYNGDSIRALRPHAPHLRTAIAMEPDRRNFKKLETYAETLYATSDFLRVLPVPAGAWSEDTTLTFHESGNRNAGLTDAPPAQPGAAHPASACADTAHAVSCGAGQTANASTIADGEISSAATPCVAPLFSMATTPFATPIATATAHASPLPSTAVNPHFGKTAAVAVRTLDSVIREARAPGEAVSLPAAPPIDFIKYDVEGAEAAALRGSLGTIRHDHPALLVSAYHRSEDLFALPLLLHEIDPDYRLYLRRAPGIPAWDINLYAVPQ